jgi:iron complex transport system permease protein
MMQASKRARRIWAWSVLFFVCCLVTAPLIGPQPVDLRAAWAHRADPQASIDAAILFHARLPRILFAALAGAALSAAGVAFQALLRNPLATPYTLGVSSGAACGAVLGMLIGFHPIVAGVPTIQIMGVLGALLTIWLVYWLGKKTGGSTHTLLLSGVTLSFFFAACIMFMQYLADFTQSYRIIHWLMGNLDIAGYDTVLRTAPGVLIGILLLWTRSAEYNLLSAGEVSAQSRGVNIRRNYQITYLAASLTVALVVCVAGPIGFVGLIVPHTLRNLTGSDNRILLPACTFCGAGFLVLCDGLARTLFAPAELPVGVLTALLGGPFFLSVLLRKRSIQPFS